jgi:hypothetical protein
MPGQERLAQLKEAAVEQAIIFNDDKFFHTLEGLADGQANSSPATEVFRTVDPVNLTGPINGSLHYALGFQTLRRFSFMTHSGAVHRDKKHRRFRLSHGLDHLAYLVRSIKAR